MVITKDGKFGFGLPVPAEKFHFKGNALFEGDVNNRGNIKMENFAYPVTEELKLLYIDPLGVIKPIGIGDLMETRVECRETMSGTPATARWSSGPAKIFVKCPEDTKVGIGTDNPQSTLDVRGNILINGSRFHVNSNGHIGIGTISPASTLDIRGDIQISGSRLFVGTNGRVGIGTNSPSVEFQVNGKVNLHTHLFIGDPANLSENSRGITIDNGGSTAWELFTLKNNSGTHLKVLGSGNVGIGTSSPSHKLQVCGTIRALEVRVNATGCDFVFDDNYALPSLAERKAFIEKNKHLPYIKPAKDMQENGMDLTEAAEGLLQNLEEITLHQIRQEERIAELLEAVKLLKTLTEEQKKEIEALKSEIEK
jgi:hypothetical protein